MKKLEKIPRPDQIKIKKETYDMIGKMLQRNTCRASL